MHQGDGALGVSSLYMRSTTVDQEHKASLVPLPLFQHFPNVSTTIVPLSLTVAAASPQPRCLLRRLRFDSSPWCSVQSPFMSSASMDTTNQTARLEPDPALSGLHDPYLGLSGSADAG